MVRITCQLKDDESSNARSDALDKLFLNRLDVSRSYFEFLHVIIYEYPSWDCRLSKEVIKILRTKYADS